MATMLHTTPLRHPAPPRPAPPHPATSEPLPPLSAHTRAPVRQQPEVVGLRAAPSAVDHDVARHGRRLERHQARQRLQRRAAQRSAGLSVTRTPLSGLQAQAQAEASLVLPFGPPITSPHKHAHWLRSKALHSKKPHMAHKHTCAAVAAMVGAPPPNNVAAPVALSGAVSSVFFLNFSICVLATGAGAGQAKEPQPLCRGMPFIH